MRTKASLGGHPIHPMLVVIPLGALPLALVFDVLQVWLGPGTWRAAGFVASLVGTAGILLAAVPGLVDYVASVPKRGAVHAIARSHMGLGLALLGYFSIVTLLRWATLTSPSPWAAWATLGASALGSLGLVAQGYLGGELRARHRLGVDSTVPEALVAAKPRSEKGGAPGGP